MSLGWAAVAHSEVRDKGALGTGSGVSPGQAAAAHCSLGASLMSSLRLRRLVPEGRGGGEGKGTSLLPGGRGGRRASAGTYW